MLYAASIGLPAVLIGLLAVAALVYGLGWAFGRGARRGSR